MSFVYKIYSSLIIRLNIVTCSFAWVFFSLFISTTVQAESKELVKFSKDNGVNIQKITIENLNDAKTLKKGAVKQIYSYPEKQIIVVNDINLKDNFIVYIEKVENASISYNSDEYKKYFDLSKIRLTSRLFNSYDNYIKKKYDIDINYKSLNIVKNYFN